MYSTRKKALNNSRYAKKIQKHRMIFSWLLVILTISIIAAAITIIRGPYLRIDEVVVTITNQDALKNQDKIAEIKAKIEAVLTDSYLYIVPKGTVISFPSDTVAANLIESDPSFTSVVIKSQGLHLLNVDILAREPKAISCALGDIDSSVVGSGVDTGVSMEDGDVDAESAEDTKQNCKFLDINAYAYAEAPAYSPGVYVVFFATTSEAFGQHIADTNKYKTFLDFSENLKQYGGNVDKIKFDTNNEYEVDVIFDQSIESVRILFNYSENDRSNKKTLAAAMDRVLKFVDSKYMAHKSSPNKSPSLSDLQYIDGRYGATVYFKYRNSQQ